MTIIEHLDKLEKDGILALFVGAGLVSPSVVIWRKAYHFYTAEALRTGSKMQAVTNTCEEFSLSERMVHYIRVRMEKY